MQQSGGQAQLQSPAKGSAPHRDKQGRGYYDQFRKKVEREKYAPRPRPAERPERAVKSAEEQKRREEMPPRQRAEENPPKPQRPKQSATTQGAKQPQRKRISPEQTARDKYEENLRRVEAMETAKRARVMRRVRDGVISLGLIFAVVIVLFVVVYRILFVITDVSAVGGVKYSSDELVLASGVREGDHLYSFSSKDIGRLMMLRCPEIDSVDVDRTPPGTIVFNITEEEPRFYADFYGEYRLLSPSMRVMRSVTEEEAKSLGCIKVKLPDIICATAGRVPEFANVRNDKYIYETAEFVLASSLCERVGSIDLCDKYNMTLTVDGKYKIKLGDRESMETKLRIAAAVLEDEMFQKDIKALIDVTDLSETSVVVDDGLKLD